jgi:hypothetical protein
MKFVTRDRDNESDENVIESVTLTFHFFELIHSVSVSRKSESDRSLFHHQTTATAITSAQAVTTKSV